MGLTSPRGYTIVSNDRMKPRANTRSRILDVAEDLFGEQGFDRVSIRDITKQAQVNLAAINYHFGSKEDLIAAVFERRVVPVNKARLAALTLVERAAGKKPQAGRYSGSVYSSHPPLFLRHRQRRNSLFETLRTLPFRTQPRS